MKQWFLLSLAPLLLAACGDSPKLVSGNVDGVAYVFDGSDEEFKEVNGRAIEDCQKSGRVAVLRNTSQMEDHFIANFACNKSS